MNTKLNGKIKSWLLYSFLVFFFLLSVSQMNIHWDRLKAGFERGMYIINIMIPPVLEGPVDIVGSALESMQIAVLGTVWGVIFSLLLCVFAARNLTPHITISYAVKAFAGFVRAVPALIWALLFIVAVGLGPTAGILALAVNSIGMLVKVYAETIEEIDVSVIEALRTTGASPFQVIMQGVIPTIMTIFVAWSIFRFDINVRYAAVLGVVGAGGIGWELVRAARLLKYDEALAVTLVIFLMVVVSEWMAQYLKKQLNVSSIQVTKHVTKTS